MEHLEMLGSILAVITAIVVPVMGTNVYMVKWIMNSFLKRMRAMEKQQSITTMALVNLQQQLLAHDLTIVGLNPSAGADFEERDSKALMKYQDIQRGFNELKNTISQNLSLHMSSP